MTVSPDKAAEKAKKQPRRAQITLAITLGTGAGPKVQYVMGFRCSVTKKHVQGKPVKVVVEWHENFEHYPVVLMKDGTEKVLYNHFEDLEKFDHVIAKDEDGEVIYVDRGGSGRQIKKEVLMSPDAAEKWLQRQKEIDLRKEQEIAQRRKAAKLQKLANDEAARKLNNKVQHALGRRSF